MIPYASLDISLSLQQRIQNATPQLKLALCAGTMCESDAERIGLFVLLIGLLYPYLRKFGLWKLPGDIILKGENSSFYFPIVTCIILSIVISITLSFFR